MLSFRCTVAGTWRLVGGNRISLSNAALTGTPTTNGIEIGYRNIPLTTKNSSYALVAGDAGKGLVHTDASARTYTVPSGVFNTGDVVTIVNYDTANITLAEGGGMTLFLGGSTGGAGGSRTVGTRGIATILFVSSTSAFVTGVGVS